MLGLGNTVAKISSPKEVSKWDNEGFLSFDGTDDKAELNVDSAFIASVAGEGNIGDNIGFSLSPRRQPRVCASVLSVN